MDFAEGSQAPVAVAVAPKKMGKFAASKQIVKESWNILKQDKEMVWFPVLSTIVSLIALAGLGVLFFYVIMHADPSYLDNKDHQVNGTVYYPFLFLFYLVTFFITNFFQACILIIANARFNGQDLTFSDGLSGASKNVGRIFVWSLISATVGLILNIIAERFKLIGRIVANILGAAWNILTYFSLTSLIIGQTSIRDSFKESASVIRKTWGETIIVSLGVGLFFGVLILATVGAGVILIVLVPKLVMVLSVLILFVLFVICISVISSTLSVIFKLALYQYARTGQVPQGFSPELIQNAIKAK